MASRSWLDALPQDQSRRRLRSEREHQGLVQSRCTWNRLRYCAPIICSFVRCLRETRNGTWKQAGNWRTCASWATWVTKRYVTRSVMTSASHSGRSDRASRLSATADDAMGNGNVVILQAYQGERKAWLWLTEWNVFSHLCSVELKHLIHYHYKDPVYHEDQYLNLTMVRGQGDDLDLKGTFKFKGIDDCESALLQCMLISRPKWCRLGCRHWRQLSKGTGKIWVRLDYCMPDSLVCC